MADWIGHFIAGWPIWAVVLVVVAVVIAGVIYYLTPNTFGDRKHEWPEDIKKRAARKNTTRKRK